MKQIIIIVVVVVAVMGLGVLLFLKGNTSPSDLAQMGQEIEIQGAGHIPDGQEHPPYNSNPPTSGPHYVQPANWGVYDDVLVDEQVVHNLEHGGIWITYKDLDEEQLSILDQIARSNFGAVVLSPRPTNDTKVAIASWGRLEKVDLIDEQYINNFIRANKNKSPEPLAR
jgi:hypothetical protein